MDADKIMNADILDLLFDGKNKAYGAYDLRKTYNKRIVIATLGMAGICLLFFLTYILANGNDKMSNKITLSDVRLDDVTKQKDTPEPPPVKPPKASIPRAEIIRVTALLITDDVDVTDPPPDINQIEHAQVGLINQAGIKDVDFTAPPVEVSTGIVQGLKKDDDEDFEKTFTKVEKEAKFPGGMEGWKKYLERNLNAGVATDDGAAMGYYTVKVRFIVDKEGGISNVEAIEVPTACPSCGPEAVKVIKKGPRWEPAIQNDRKVNYQAIQLVTFQVAEE
jgi:protein TonB